MTRKTLCIFDKQLLPWRERLMELGLTEWQVRKVATCVFEEVTHFQQNLRSELLSSSPVPARQRLSEIEWFVYFNGTFGHMLPNPGFARAFTITSNYVSFVYLGDTVYRVLAGSSPGTASHALGQFLRSSRLRDFRHALAHGHWMICPDGSGIEYWPRPDPRSPSQLVNQEELIFWYSVSRATGYAALAGVVENPT